jgi:hypothetical protein
VEPLPKFLVTLTRNIKSKEIFRLNSLNHIIIKVEYTELRLALRSATTAKTFAMSGPTASNPFDVCGVLEATCIENALERQMQNQC